MKLEVGMYARLNDGTIGKITKYEYREQYINCHIIWLNNERVGEALEPYEFKASHNIIDLIEVGDIITFEDDRDVYKVHCIPNEYQEEFWLVFEHEGAAQLGFEDIEVSKEVMEESLESILTKEEFENRRIKIR